MPNRSPFMTVASLFCGFLVFTPNYASAQGEASAIEEIIVTGERVPRSLRETAASAVVITADDLDLFAGDESLTRIFNNTANVSWSGAGNQGPTIRGSNSSGVLTSLESFFGGSQPRTTIQVDGRQLTFNEFVFSGESAWDIQQVEIFRGPQTTTQGRNAIAGAVYVETVNPDHDAFELNVRAVAGERDSRQFALATGGPIGDGQLAYRLSGDYNSRESFVQPLGLTEDIGANPRDTDLLNLRGKLSFRPASLQAFSALLTLTHADTRRPQTESVDQPFDNLQRINPGFSVFNTRSNAASLKMVYALDDAISLTNTSTFSDVSVQRLAPLGTGNADIDTDDLTNELILTFAPKQSDWSGLVGVYASSLDSQETLNLAAFGIGVGSFDDERTSAGVFSELTWSFAEQWAMTIGGRWQRDSQDRQGGFEGIIPVSFDESFNQFLPKAEIAYDISADTRIGFLAERGFNAGGFTFNFDTFSAETFDAETLWNYEVFLRTRLLDDRLMINANVFLNDIDDLQVATLVELGPGFLANVFSNAESARALGAEIDLKYLANERLTLQAGLGFSDTEYRSNSNAGALIDGNEFQRTPGLTMVAGAAWSITERFDVSAFGRYSDGYFSDDANLAVDAVDSYFTLDLQASYEFDRARVFLEVTNATDAFYELAVFNEGTLANVGAPRLATIGIDVRF